MGLSTNLTHPPPPKLSSQAINAIITSLPAWTPSIAAYGLQQGSASFFCEGPESKYLRLYGLNGLCLNYSVLSLQPENRHGLCKRMRVAYLQNQAEGWIVWGPLGLWLGNRGWDHTRQLAPKQDKGAERSWWVHFMASWAGVTCFHRGISSVLCVSGSQACGFKKTELREEAAKEKAAWSQKMPKALPKR